MKYLRNECGLSIILFVFCFPLILILAAFAVDSGRIFLAKNELKRSTDMAALSAAGAIPDYYTGGDVTKVRAMAEMFNGTPGDDYVNDILGSIDPAIVFDDHGTMVNIDTTTGAITNNPPVNSVNGVTIARKIEVPALFTSLIGYDKFDVSVKSTATLLGPRCFPVEFPIALLTCDLGNDNCSDPSCGDTITTELTPSTVDDAAIFYLEKNPNPGGAAHCKAIVDGTLDTSICVGDTISLNNGQVTSCLGAMEDECAPTERNCAVTPWEVYIPVIDCTEYDAGGQNFVAEPKVAGITKIGVIEIDSGGGAGGGGGGNDKFITFKRICDELAIGPPGGGSVCGIYSPPFLVE